VTFYHSKAAAKDADSLLMFEGYVAQATVQVVEKSCTGFVAGSTDYVVTAAHCIPEAARRVTVQKNGKRYGARVSHLDRDKDLALLRLDRPLAIPPLELSVAMPVSGQQVLFAGGAGRPGAAQVAEVERIGRGPSLPRINNAIFTSIDARPGDSGAPVVDAQLRVVGIVHGGARCHILAPVVPLAEQLRAELPNQGSDA
jgi:S1-C subfamily serine protease